MGKSGYKWMKNRNSRIVKIDEKGRVFLPTSIRRGLFYGEKIILTTGFEPCIYAFSASNWEKLKQEIGVITPFSKPEIKNTYRHLQGNSEEIELDSQGRFLIPGHLFEYARLKDRVFFIKMDTWFELWNPHVFAEYQKKHPVNAEWIYKNDGNQIS